MVRLTSMAGALLFSTPVLIFVASTVIKGEREQGMLYHEDGPLGFFIIAGIMLLALLLCGAVFGGVIGAITCVVGAFLSSSIDDDANLKDRNSAPEDS